MKKPQPHIDPFLFAAACVPTAKDTAINWHDQPCDGICLHTDGSTQVGIGDKKIKGEQNMLFLVKRGVQRGSWNEPHRKPPKLWCILYSASEGLYQYLPHLSSSDPMSLIWRLTAEQAADFKGMFVKLISEQTVDRPARLLAQSAWLKLILVILERWASHKKVVETPPDNVPADVLELWQKVNQLAMNPDESRDLLKHAFPNYNSLRHRFKHAFGMSPQQMLFSLRIEHAKNLLLGSDLSIKEIALRLGYGRPHEFTRAFHRHVGASPTQWRVNPTRASLG